MKLIKIIAYGSGHKILTLMSAKVGFSGSSGKFGGVKKSKNDVKSMKKKFLA